MSVSGVSVDPKAVMSWERPKLVFKICSFLGLAGYYKWFIEDFSRLAAPMTRLARNEVKFEWNDLCERAFQELKRRLTSAPILIVSKRRRGYIVYCDAANDGLVCLLMQFGRVALYRGNLDSSSEKRHPYTHKPPKADLTPVSPRLPK